jgi:ribosome biogenesis GTPase A
MAAGSRAIHAIADLFDIVLEVRDARLPLATAVAHLNPRLRTKPTLVLLNRQDLAQPAWTRKWLSFFHAEGRKALATTATHAGSLRNIRAAVTALRPKGRVRVGVVGAPNTGKSSLINALARRKKAVVENKPGVTRHVRWIALDERVDVLDTPGMLEPRISNATTTWQLGLCGILPEGTFDAEEVACAFLSWARGLRPQILNGVDFEGLARERGMLRRGGEIDRPNAARALLKAFRDGRFGRFTFEFPGESR